MSEAGQLLQPCRRAAPRRIAALARPAAGKSIVNPCQFVKPLAPAARKKPAAKPKLAPKPH